MKPLHNGRNNINGCMHVSHDAKEFDNDEETVFGMKTSKRGRYRRRKRYIIEEFGINADYDEVNGHKDEIDGRSSHVKGYNVYDFM